VGSLGAPGWVLRSVELKLRPGVGRVLFSGEEGAAHRLLADRAEFGKIVLTP